MLLIFVENMFHNKCVFNFFFVFEYLRINRIVLQKIYSLKYIPKNILQNIVHSKTMTILIHTNCVHYHVVYWTGYCDCVHHGLKCVLKSLRTYVCFTGLQEGTYFCCNQLFTASKLRGDEIFFSFSMLYKWNENTKIHTASRGHRDHYRRLDFTSQHTHTHTHTHTQTHT